jgi:hypothetical protein
MRPKYDIVAACISSNMPSILSPEDVIISRCRSSFALSGLISDSVIMLDQLATVEKALIIAFWAKQMKI